MSQEHDESRQRRFNPLVGSLVLLAGPLLGFGVGYLLTRPAGPSPPAPQLDGVALLVAIVSSLIAGAALLLLAAGLYLMVVFTGCLTFDYGRPVFKRLKPRMFVANLVIVTLLLVGVALLVSAVLEVAFRALGIGFSPWVVAIVGTAVVLNVALVRFFLWAPFEARLAARRLLAAGVPGPDVARGLCIGISDPDVSGWKKAILEDDIGMLWVEPDRLVYKGDAEAFEITRRDLVDIERAVVAASVTAYAGNRHVVLRFKTGAGERRARLHVQGCWSVGRVVKATDQLADRLEAWRRAAGAAGDGA